MVQIWDNFSSYLCSSGLQDPDYRNRPVTGFAFAAMEVS
jgi:hypothetical protein